MADRAADPPVETVQRQEEPSERSIRWAPDDASAAAFVFRMIGIMDQKLDVFSWWTFSDVSY